jgi:ribosomal protein S18 acetylase RimI-like enzyme
MGRGRPRPISFKDDDTDKLIERVETDDALRALHLLLVEYERSLPEDLRHGREPQIEELGLVYLGRSGAFLAKISDRCVGCASIRELNDTDAVLQRLYVQPAHRGRGIARALTVSAIEFSRAADYERVVLDTDAARLKAAASLYLSLGFRQCEPFACVSYVNPTFMELRLR